MVKDIKERITEVLEKNPKGLTTVEISKILGMHRHTLTKYIYQLVGEKVIYQIEVGTAKLCYLSESNEQ